MRDLMKIVEGFEMLGNVEAVVNPTPAQIVGLCQRLSKYQILRGWFFTTKTDSRVQCVLWAAEDMCHALMQENVVKAGFDALASEAIICGLSFDAVMETCDWESYDLYQSGSIFYVRDDIFYRPGTNAQFDASFARFFPGGELVDYDWIDGKYQII